MASWKKEIYTCPYLYDYSSPDVEKPKIIGYFSVDENFEPIEDLSSLKYLSCKPIIINVDVNSDETDPRIQIKKPVPFFKYIALHKEIIQRVTGTRIEDAGFVFGKTTLSQLGSALHDKWSNFILCAHLLRGVIYVYHNLETYNFNVFPDKFKFFYYKTDDSNSNKRKTKFVTLMEANLMQHNILYTSEICGLEATDNEEEISPNLEKDLVINELNKRKIVDVVVSTNRIFTRPKSMRVWTKCFWGNIDKTICGFANENDIVTHVNCYNTGDLEDIGMGHWKERGILNYTGELLTFIKDCFKEKFKCVDVKSANERLYFQKNEYEDSIKLMDEVNFDYTDWIPDWYLNNQTAP